MDIKEMIFEMTQDNSFRQWRNFPNSQQDLFSLLLVNDNIVIIN